MSLHCSYALNSVKDILEHVHCKKVAYFTLHNPKTGNHYTYKVSKDKQTYILSVLTGDDNTECYTCIGRIYPYGYRQDLSVSDDVYMFDKKQYEQMPASEKAAYFCLNDPARYLEAGGQFLVPSLCRRCGRMLTTPQAINDGIGHKCKAKEAKHEG